MQQKVWQKNSFYNFATNYFYKLKLLLKSVFIHRMRGWAKVERIVRLFIYYSFFNILLFFI